MCLTAFSSVQLSFVVAVAIAVAAVDGASCSSNSSNNNNIIGSLRLQFQPSFDLCYVVDTHIREPEAAAANADTDTFLLTICRRRHLSHLCPSSTPPLPKSTLRIVHLTKKKFAKKNHPHSWFTTFRYFLSQLSYKCL